MPGMPVPSTTSAGEAPSLVTVSDAPSAPPAPSSCTATQVAWACLAALVTASRTISAKAAATALSAGSSPVTCTSTPMSAKARTMDASPELSAGRPESAKSSAIFDRSSAILRSVSESSRPSSRYRWRIDRREPTVSWTRIFIRITASSSATLLTCAIEAPSSSLAASSSLLTLARRLPRAASSLTSSAMICWQHLPRSTASSRTKRHVEDGVVSTSRQSGAVSLAKASRRSQSPVASARSVLKPSAVRRPRMASFMKRTSHWHQGHR